MEQIIMIHAKAQSGKNTVADIIKEEYEKIGKRVLIIAEADYVKFVLSKYYGVNDFKSPEGRHRIQTFATDQCRGIDNEMWVRVVVNLLHCIQDDWDIVLIPDWRFYNEFTYTLMNFGAMVKTMVIIRPDVQEIDNMSDETRTHISETELDNVQAFDYTILNHTNNLEATRQQVIEQIFAKS